MMMDNRNIETLQDESLEQVAGGYQINTGGNGYNVSGSYPSYGIGELLRISYGSWRAKCSVREVSAYPNGGMSGREYTYTIQIVWLPASCPAAATDVGRYYYNVAESSLSRG